jgi:hypothetical protein
MSDVKSMLSKRFEKGSHKTTKMDQLAAQTSSGALSSFAGVFKVNSLTEKEKTILEELLKNYSHETQEISSDLESLSSITSEVKAINNQAIILHGERIKKAQIILKQYRDGAFSAWLMTTYGNRQTPYNFLQYYELYTTLSEALQKAIDLMPKQVIYTLASREASLEEKKKFILGYKGESKNELLAQLRDVFPLDEEDLRKTKPSQKILQELNKLISLCSKKTFRPTLEEKEELLHLLDQLRLLALKKPS